jgi:tryptophan-rich sensory protein
MAGIIGSFFTRQSVDTWYASLQKPSFSPPNWVFAPVWITLYFIMGISAFLVWQKGLKTQNVRTALLLFISQLIVNSMWSMVFFGRQSIAGGFVIIVILWMLILFTIIRFRSISMPATLLLIPYILWVSFAALLNFSILVMNT